MEHPERIGISALAVSSLFLLSACGNGSDGSVSGDYEAADTDLEASITYGLWDQEQVPSIEAMIEEFNEEYPNIEVNLNVTPFSEYWTVLQTQATSGELPDIFWMNGPNIGLYAANEMLEPIDGAVEAGDIETEPYPEGLIELYNLDDVQYGVPKDFDTVALYANTALFEEAGVELPEDDWTWDEFLETAEELSEALGDDVYGVTAAPNSGQTAFYNQIFQTGGWIVEGGESGYDTPEAHEGLQFWADLFQSDTAPTVAQLTDTEADQWFYSERTAMYQGGSWIAAAISGTDIEDDVDVLPLPIGEEQASVIHGVANVVAAEGENIEAAQAFQNFLATEEAQQIQADGGIISAYEGTQDEFLDSIPNANLQVFLDAADYAQPLPASSNTAAWNALEEDLLTEAWTGERSVEDVAADLAEQMDEALADEEE